MGQKEKATVKDNRHTVEVQSNGHENKNKNKGILGAEKRRRKKRKPRENKRVDELKLDCIKQN